MREHEHLPGVAWTADLFHRKDVVPCGNMDEEDAVASGSHMAESVGQASVVVRKSGEQRDLENTKAPRGRAEF
eukprot:6282978-Karenia_brevis.AAC.1